MNEDIPEISTGPPNLESHFCDGCYKFKFCKLQFGLWLCWECLGHTGMKEQEFDSRQEE